MKINFKKLTKILTKKWQLKNDILYANERIYISFKKLRNALFKQNHDDFYAKHFEYEKIFELIRRKYWWLKLIRNVKEYFEFCIDCYRIKFTKHKLYNFIEFLSVFKNSRQNWILNFIIDFFCRFLNRMIVEKKNEKTIFFLLTCEKKNYYFSFFFSHVKREMRKYFFSHEKRREKSKIFFFFSHISHIIFRIKKITWRLSIWFTYHNNLSNYKFQIKMFLKNAWNVFIKNKISWMI